jgi:hypothetical protein
MKTVKFCLMTGLAFGLPFAAAAQHSVATGTPSDIKQCNAMAKLYSKLFPVQQAMPAADVVTLSRCDSDPQATIAALERKLKDKNIELPPDDRVAQPPASTHNSQ